MSQVGAPKLSQIIRSFTFPQIQNLLADHKGGYCIMGGLYKYFGYDFAIAKEFSTDSIPAYREIKKLCGDISLHHLIDMNNSGSTFDEIADYVESQGL